MTRSALSDQVKKQQKRAAEDQKYSLALEAYTKEKEKPISERRGVRKIGEEFGVNYRTLSNLSKPGAQSISDFNATKKKLSTAEEDVLVKLIIESADRGFPLTHPIIISHANEIIEAREGPDFVPVGTKWITRFLNRYRDEIQTHWSRPLDTQRARALNPDVVRSWFDLLEEHIVKPGIRPEDIYGMDESGFPPSRQGRERVIGRRGTKVQHSQGRANKENVTAIVTICANGTTLRPTIIFKGQQFMKRWAENNVSDASYVLTVVMQWSLTATAIACACPQMVGQTVNWH